MSFITKAVAEIRKIVGENKKEELSPQILKSVQEVEDRISHAIYKDSEYDESIPAHRRRRSIEDPTMCVYKTDEGVAKQLMDYLPYHPPLASDFASGALKVSQNRDNYPYTSVVVSIDPSKADKNSK